MLTAEARANKQCAAELAEPYRRKAEALEHHADRLRKLMLEQMERLGVDKLKGVVSKAFVKRSTSVQTTPDFCAKADRRFVRVTEAPDKVAIAEALDRGEHVEDAWIETSRRVDFR
jgi:hypothetical protein